MNRKAIFLMVLAALSAVLPAAAAEPDQFRGDRAWTIFAEIEPGGCTFHSVSIDISAGSEGPAQLIFSAYRYSLCNGADPDFFAISRFVDLPPDVLKVQGNLHGATLNATLQIEDELSGTTVPVTIALEWTGLGDVSRGTYRSRYSDGTNFTRLISSGLLWDAQASGSVVVGGFEMLTDRSDGGLASLHVGSLTRLGS